MRFPNETIPAAVPAIDTIEVTPKTAVSPVRRIGDGSRGASAQPGGREEVDEGRREFYQREGEDRRKMCRRIYHIPVMLDTRSGEERRKETRRPDDPLTHMDQEV